jgi:hypothetical protein
MMGDDMFTSDGDFNHRQGTHKFNQNANALIALKLIPNRQK